jgi:3-oxoadipate enol-lactonase
MPEIQVPGVRLHVEEQGSGTAVLLLHGLGSSGAEWEQVAPQLAKRYRVIAPDCRGHGRSERPAGPYPVAQHGADLAALCDQMGVRAAHVVGLSMGGMIAFELAVKRPDLVRSAVIINSGPDMVPRTLQLKLAFATRIVLHRLLGQKRWSRMLARKLFPAPEQASVRERVEAQFASNPPDAYARATRGLIGWSVIDRIGEIDAPALIVSSERDYTPLALKQAYAAKMKRARVVELKSSGHAADLERPEELRAMIEEFLDEVEGPPRSVAS